MNVSTASVTPVVISAAGALDRLRAGNARFANGRPEQAPLTPARRAGLAVGQRPLAVVLGCSDSRVPPEIVFDQGVGDLFVVRVAGNVAAPTQIGSIELAAEQFGVRLVVVLGHLNCGAVRAILDELRRPTASRSTGFAAIVERIAPSIEPLLEANGGLSDDTVVRRAVRTNVLASVAALRQESAILADLSQSDALRILPAEYSLDTGVVDFFEDAAG